MPRPPGVTVPSARRLALERVAAAVHEVRRDHPVRVAIDGVDGAGKTTMADELALALERLGRPCVRASIDGFHHPRAVRYRRGRRSAMGYYLDSFDLEALRRELLAPLGPGGSRPFRRRALRTTSGRWSCKRDR